MAALGLSLAAASGAFSSCGAWASHCGGVSYCREQSLDALASIDAARTRTPAVFLSKWQLHCSVVQKPLTLTLFFYTLVNLVIFIFKIDP